MCQRGALSFLAAQGEDCGHAVHFYSTCDCFSNRGPKNFIQKNQILYLVVGCILLQVNINALRNLKEPTPLSLQSVPVSLKQKNDIILDCL